MRRIGVRHVDNRRCLLPRDYLQDPFTFGTRGGVVVLPVGGDPVSMRIARRQHLLVIAVRERRIRSSAVCGDFGFGRDVWSDVLNGTRWAGETVLVAIFEALASAQV